MVEYFGKFFFLVVISSLPVLAQPAPAHSKISPELQQKLQKFWEIYEGNNKIAESSVTGYRNKNREPDAIRLRDPQIYQKAVTEISTAFQTKLAETMSEAEIEYLIKLYTSPLSKKLSSLESSFWTPDNTGLLIKKATTAVPAVPAAPAVAPAAPAGPAVNQRPAKPQTAPKK